MRTRFEILVFFLAFFALSIPSEAQEIQPGDTIVICQSDNVLFATTDAIDKKGPKKKLDKYLVSEHFDGKYAAISEKFNETQFLVYIGGRPYLMSIGNPKDKKTDGKTGELFFIHKSFADSLKSYYLEQLFYDHGGRSFRYGDIFWGKSVEIRASDWATSHYRSGSYHKVFIGPDRLTANGRYLPHNHNLVNEKSIRSYSEMVAERDARWPINTVDALRAKYVGDTLVLGKNLYDLRDSIEFRYTNGPNVTKEHLDLCTQYAKIVVDSLYMDIVRERNDVPQHMEYRLSFHPVTNYKKPQVTILVDDINYPHLILTDEEYAAYLDEQRRLEQKRLEYIALSEQEWLEQQRALNEREMQFLEIYTKVYGEETGLDIWWGRIKFGFTEDMCKNAYRNSGMYRIKEHVSTPLGDAKQIHFLERQTILYFIDDCLIGVTIYGKTTWDNVF